MSFLGFHVDVTFCRRKAISFSRCLKLIQLTARVVPVGDHSSYPKQVPSSVALPAKGNTLGGPPKSGFQSQQGTKHRIATELAKRSMGEVPSKPRPHLRLRTGLGLNHGCNLLHVLQWKPFLVFKRKPPGKPKPCCGPPRPPKKNVRNTQHKTNKRRPFWGAWACAIEIKGTPPL